MTSDAILYLDFDGVLHPEDVWWHPRRGAYLGDVFANTGHKLFEHAALLESLLEPYAAVRIVLSTSWVRRYRYSKTAKHLPLALRERCIGSTFHTSMDERAFEEMPRGMQVVADVGRRQPRAWLAVDDTCEGWPLLSGDNIVITHPELDISHPPVLAKLRSKLESQFGGLAVCRTEASC